MHRILLVEDDPIIAKGISVNLELETYHVQWAQNLQKAASSLEKTSVDLIILDLGLPDGSGLDFLKKVRQAKVSTPVLILTAQANEDSVVEGFEAGANDYVRKPFSNRELLARIGALLRAKSKEKRITLGGLSISLEKRKVSYEGQAIDLNRREFDVLAYFIQHQDNVVTRDALLESLDKNGEIFDRTIDTHVSRLRSRLKLAGVQSIQITSIYGVGYRMERS